MSIKRYFQFNKYPRVAKQMIISYKDVIRLKHKYPDLRNFTALSTKTRDKLQPYHQRYTKDVSFSSMAISLKLAIFLDVICNMIKPKAILDLGSGFSSFVFRRYAADAASKPITCSVDDSPEWLQKTRDFLLSHNTDTENLFLWDSFVENNNTIFDFILHDLSAGEKRNATLNKALKFLKPGGVIVLDDAHSPVHDTYMKCRLRELNYKYYTLDSFTRDETGRYALLAAQ